ncbi:uncharacterized protein EAE98_010530 [Botrytis deweyae]|uniref:Uncharacterized protein n=1 Tax=Botrytis deweyae TaxID=2478750 RepID=A0ABQ7I8H0_9HELO|nr:uncharacterized protein EAE98_010530 [Botrytis deweyae]KAF7916808.1 hypothetical protein EAE98_010530 [Botrytis deweyae]
MNMNPYHVHVYPYRPVPPPRVHPTPNNIRDYYAFPQNRLPPLRIVYGNNQSNEVVRRHPMSVGRTMEPNARISGPYDSPYVRYVTYRRMGWGP